MPGGLALRLRAASLLVSLVCAIGLVSAGAGCSIGGRAEATGVATGETLSGRFPTAVYRRDGDSAADIYLTDLTRDQLEPALPVEVLRGQLVHLRMFVRPRAGRTAISDEGTNTTVRWAVFAGTGAELHAGVYEGAGFLLPGGVIGGGALRGKMDGASLNLASATTRFQDPIGPIDAAVRFTAVEDPAAVALIERRMRTALLGTGPVRPAHRVRPPSDGQAEPIPAEVE